MGTIATNVLGRRTLARVERLFIRVPIFRSIYPSIKQLIESFSPEKRQSFKAVVLGRAPARRASSSSASSPPRSSWRRPAGKREMVTVFVPTNNSYLGDVIMVPRQDVISTGLTVEEGIRIILSAGTGHTLPAAARAALIRDARAGTSTSAAIAPPPRRAGRACRRRSARAPSMISASGARAAFPPASIASTGQ